MSYQTYEMICTQCGQEFTAKSTKAKYHSSACRTAAHRIRKIKAMPAASKGDKLKLLLDESDKITHSLNQLIEELKVNRSNRLWDRINELRGRDRVLIREIADLVAN